MAAPDQTESRLTMNFDWSVALGQLIGPLLTLAVLVGGSWTTYIIFRTRTDARLESMSKDIKKEGEHKDEQIGEINRRLSDMAAGGVTTSNELRDFKSHVERHFVEKDEIAELKGSFDRSIDRMQQSLDAAVGTMGDVRDAVLVLTAKNSKPSVPSQRRPARPKAAE